MAVTINASTSAGLVQTADTSGVLALQTAGTTAISIDASQAVTFTNSPTVTGGTANGVAYLNGSKVLTTGSALTFDGSTLALTGVQTITNSSGSTLILDRTSNAGSLQLNFGGTQTGQVQAASGGGLIFYQGSTPTEGMRLNSTGLGIGVSSPVSILDVNAKGTGTTPNAVKTYTSYMHGSTIGTNVGELTGWGVRYGTIGATPVWYGARFLRNGVNAASDFTIWTSPDGDVTTLAERVAVTASGNLLVGTTSTTINTTNFGAYVSQDGGVFASRNQDGSVVVFYTGGNAGAFRVLGNGNAQNTNNSYGAISDVKLKENIVDASPKLADLMQVKVRNYNLIGDTTKQIGVVAQELETVFPSMIDATFDKDAEGNDLGTTTKSVKYSVFVPMLIKAIQEQQALITQLQADVAALKGATP